jgi:hypothetical protein
MVSLLVLLFIAGCGNRPVVAYLNSLAAIASADRVDWEALCARERPFTSQEFAEFFSRGLERRESLYSLVDSIPEEDWNSEPRYQLAGEALLAQLTHTVGALTFRQLDNQPGQAMKEVRDRTAPYYDFVTQAFEEGFSRVEGSIQDRFRESIPPTELFITLALGKPLDLVEANERINQWAEGRREELRAP